MVGTLTHGYCSHTHTHGMFVLFSNRNTSNVCVETLVFIGLLSINKGLINMNGVQKVLGHKKQPVNIYMALV